MPLTTPPFRPLTSRPARGVGEGFGSGFRGFLKTAFRPEMTILPIGTAAINESSAPGTTTRALSVDNVETFYGRPTTKLVVTGAGTTAYVEVGVSTATVTLGTEAQNLLTRNVFVAVKTDGANTPNMVSVYLGDSTYANFRTVQGYFPDTLPNGWMIFERIEDSTQFTTTTGTPPALSSAMRGKLRIQMTGNVVAGTVWVGICAVVPRVRPTVVFTVDDGYDDLVWLAAQAKTRGVPISFGITADYVGTAGYVTTSDIQTIASDPSGLFEFNNDGKGPGTVTSLGVATYAANADYCRDFLVGLGLDPFAASLHAFEQGDYSDAAITEMKARGYYSARGVGGRNVSSRNAMISLGTYKAMFNVPVASYLEDAETLPTTKARITNAASRGTAFILGHRFEAVAGANTWVAGYDANNGALDLLDWLASQRDTQGWRLLRWSDWARQVQAGAQPL